MKTRRETVYVVRPWVDRLLDPKMLWFALIVADLLVGLVRPQSFGVATFAMVYGLIIGLLLKR